MCAWKTLKYFLNALITLLNAHLKLTNSNKLNEETHHLGGEDNF